MIYLKNFNESNYDITEIQEFCNNNLAYLIDDGFKINIQTNATSGVSSLMDYEYRISIKNSYDNLGTRNKKFSWESVKDEIVPFLLVLNDKYEVSQEYYKNVPKDGIKFTISNNPEQKFRTDKNFRTKYVEYSNAIDDDFDIDDLLKIEIVVKER